MNNKRWYCAMIICFVSIISKGITLDWAKHNASDSILEYDLKRINVRSCALDNPLIELINRVALSKHFMNFSIQFVRTDIFDDPLVLIADECTSSIFEKRKEFVGVFIANNSYNYFVKADSGMLWRQYFKYAEDEERIEFRQIHVPDSVYIVLPDIRSVCLAKIGEKSCKILYCEIDGKVQEEDEKFMELFQYTHYMSCHFSHLFVTDGTGVQSHKYGAKELDRENGLDLYDSHARWYDPLLTRTSTQDPLAEKYRHLSPYAWCAANPIRNIDEGGDSIAVLYYHGLIGHLALLIQDENKKWSYFSMNGTKIFGGSSGMSYGKSGGKPYNDLGIMKFNSPTELFQWEAPK